MKSYCLALLAALTLSAGSGCCLVDHLLGHQCGCGGGCDDCAGQACSYCGPHCGACGCCGGDCSCPPGGCGPGGCANCNGAAATGGMEAGVEEGYVEEGPATSAPAKRAPARTMPRQMMPASHVRPGVRQTSYEGETVYENGGQYDNGQGQAEFCGHQEFQPNCPSCLQCRAPCGRAGNCSPCPNCCDGRRAVADQLGGPAGPPCGQVTYPYYTTRGPRDFLKNNPPRIGPG